MKENWYKSNVTKAVLVVTAHVLVIVMTACFIWLLSYPALRAEIFAGKPAKEYKELCREDAGVQPAGGFGH